MTPEQLSKSIHCDVSQDVAVSSLIPLKTINVATFEHRIHSAVSAIKKQVPEPEFKRFELLIAETLRDAFAGAEFQDSLQALQDHPSPSLSDVQAWVTLVISRLIEINLANAFTAFYSFTNTVPAVGQVFGILQFEKSIQEIFKDYKQLHFIIPETKYYLQSCMYEEAACFAESENKPTGQFSLKFCRYSIDDF